MAAKINVADTAALTRQDTFRVNPADVKPGRNARMLPAANYQDQVRQRAIDIAKNGQLQPVEVRRDADKSLILNFGFTRKDAVELLRAGFDAIDPESGATVRFHQPDATLWVKVVDCGSDEAFTRGIKENLERNDTTDLQEAKQQEELRTTQGWTDAAIARFYGYTNQNRVAALSKLLTLPEAVQQKVHAGKLALHAALLTLKLSAEQREAVIDAAIDGKGRVDGAALKTLIRATLEDKSKPAEETTDETEGEGGGKTEETEAPATIKRGIKDVRNWIAETLTDESLSDAAIDFLKTFDKWVEGKRTTATLTNKFEGLTYDDE